MVLDLEQRRRLQLFSVRHWTRSRFAVRKQGRFATRRSILYPVYFLFTVKSRVILQTSHAQSRSAKHNRNKVEPSQLPNAMVAMMAFSPLHGHYVTRLTGPYQYNTLANYWTQFEMQHDSRKFLCMKLETLAKAQVTRARRGAQQKRTWRRGYMYRSIAVQKK